MQDWFVSWQVMNNDKTVKSVGYRVFSSSHKDPAVVLADQIKEVAEKQKVDPYDILVMAFNKV
ncbi:hypothetical protein [Serratia nematodiphila]|jgi:hypothetical protein|uniref:hypothetical protein n=1 Tax=Serratia nematodiphila TaxID=458197 RepID=UPI0011DBB74B|nr:hypothetical protein [Serratia nematodiphila]TXE64566.1 hypothetical protein FOT58_09485 [Serratia nematodiphila]